MTVTIGRRELLAALGGAAVVWPLAARAQQPAMPVTGFLSNGWQQSCALRLAAFWQGLSEIGYVEGRHLAIEYRWAEDHYDRLPALAAELVQRQGNSDRRRRWSSFSTRGQAGDQGDSDGRERGAGEATRTLGPEFIRCRRLGDTHRQHLFRS
jgi:hypothetical protein